MMNTKDNELLEMTLKLLESGDNLEANELAEQIVKMTNIRTLKKEYPENTIKRRSDGRYYKHVNRKAFSSMTYEGLIEKIYKEFYTKKEYTLEEIFPQFQIYRRDDENVSSNTLKDHNGYWKNYIKGSKLVKMPIENITAKDIKDFYKSVVTNNEISEGTFDFIRTILNKLFDYAIGEMEILKYNPVPSVKVAPYKKHFKAKRDTYKDVYKIKDRTKLLQYLEQHNDDIYSLATQLAFRLVIRFGELSALRWEDINDEYVSICHQRVERQVMNDDLTFEPRTMENIDRMKGGQEEGKRRQYLTEQSREILKKVKELNPNGEFVFMVDGRQFNTCTFNRHLKKLCDEAGVEYHSSHKIRFTSASMLYDGSNLAYVSRLLGHTTTQMTLHYFRNIIDEDEARDLMKKLDTNYEN